MPRKKATYDEVEDNGDEQDDIYEEPDAAPDDAPEKESDPSLKTAPMLSGDILAQQGKVQKEMADRVAAEKKAAEEALEKRKPSKRTLEEQKAGAAALKKRSGK